MFNKSKLTRYLNNRKDRRIDEKINKRQNKEAKLIYDTIDKAIELVNKDGLLLLSEDNFDEYRRAVLNYTIPLLIDTKYYPIDYVIDYLQGRLKFEIDNIVGDILQWGN